jgi:hypothetical protein
MQRSDKKDKNHHFGIATLFLAAAIALVHALPFNSLTLKAEKRVGEKAELRNKPVEILRDVKILPAEVERVRQAILEAAATGNIDALRVPVEMNEIPPIVSAEKISDPIAYWRTASGDGEGREILATLIQLFRSGFVRHEEGTNEELYVWPYFADMPLDQLTPAQEVELMTIVPPERVKAMKLSGRYDHYRIGITHDGRWHYFTNKVD